MLAAYLMMRIRRKCPFFSTLRAPTFRSAPASTNPFPLIDPTIGSSGLHPQFTQLQPQFTQVQPQFTSFNPYAQLQQQEAMQVCNKQLFDKT